MINKYKKREKGQGLVEYALILVLVAIVVIAILLQLGPEVGRVFSRVTAVLQSAGAIPPGGAITGVIPNYVPADTFNSIPAKLTVTVTVSQDVTVSLSGDVSGSKPCSSSCNFTFNNPPSNGSVTATDNVGGKGVTVTW